MKEIQEKLDQLAEVRAEEDYLKIKKQELIDSVLTPEIQEQLHEIDQEFAPQFAAIDKRTKDITDNIKDEVLAHGESVRGNTYHAVWVKGRVKWNDKGLMQYLAMHPEIAYLREVGDPSVSIRKVG